MEVKDVRHLTRTPPPSLQTHCRLALPEGNLGL